MKNVRRVNTSENTATTWQYLNPLFCILQQKEKYSSLSVEKNENMIKIRQKLIFRHAFQTPNKTRTSTVAAETVQQNDQLTWARWNPIFSFEESLCKLCSKTNSWVFFLIHHHSMKSRLCAANLLSTSIFCIIFSENVCVCLNPANNVYEKYS